MNGVDYLDKRIQYELGEKTDIWMSGGASGSVFIDSNLKLCGIY
jgi:hypothetical protein